jgi:hypothetical protein
VRTCVSTTEVWASAFPRAFFGAEAWRSSLKRRVAPPMRMMSPWLRPVAWLTLPLMTTFASLRGRMRKRPRSKRITACSSRTSSSGTTRSFLFALPMRIRPASGTMVPALRPPMKTSWAMERPIVYSRASGQNLFSAAPGRRGMTI